MFPQIFVSNSFAHAQTWSSRPYISVTPWKFAACAEHSWNILWKSIHAKWRSWSLGLDPPSPATRNVRDTSDYRKHRASQTKAGCKPLRFSQTCFFSMYYFVLFARCLNARLARDFRFFATEACSVPSCELKKWSANENIEHTGNLTHSKCINKDRICCHALP